jgi:hypothetical protein
LPQGYIVASQSVIEKDVNMCLRQAVLLALLAAPLAGCAPTPVDRSTVRGAGGLLGGPTGRDVVQLYVALIERPLDDPALNGKVWELVDEQNVRLDREISMEHQGLLADNGFRIGQVAGSPPAELFAMLNSDRSCPRLRRVSLHAGKVSEIDPGKVWQHCRYQLHRDGTTTTIDLEQAACQLAVVPTLDDDGKIQLHFTPIVKHGKPSLDTKPSQDPSGSLYWDRKVEQPTESYEWLGWDLSLAENEYVLIGCRPQRDDTLGARCFLDADAATPVQRLLVLRVAHGPADGAPDEDAVRAAPLALQASWTR